MERYRCGFAGQGNLARIKSDFAAQNVYGIEIHPTLARICKISLLLHHDGHTNIEADKSCLSPNLSKPKLQKDRQFDLIVGNPPFGTKVADGDEDQLDGASWMTTSWAAESTQYSQSKSSWRKAFPGSSRAAGSVWSCPMVFSTTAGLNQIVRPFVNGSLNRGGYCP